MQWQLTTYSQWRTARCSASRIRGLRLSPQISAKKWIPLIAREQKKSCPCHHQYQTAIRFGFHSILRIRFKFYFKNIFKLRKAVSLSKQKYCALRDVLIIKGCIQNFAELIVACPQPRRFGDVISETPNIRDVTHYYNITRVNYVCENFPLTVFTLSPTNNKLSSTCKPLSENLRLKSGCAFI